MPAVVNDVGFFDGIRKFFGIGGFKSGFSALEESVLSAAASAERTQKAYEGIVSDSGQFLGILQGAAGIGAFFGNYRTGDGGEVLSAYREVTKQDSGLRNFTPGIGISGGTAAVMQYSAALGAARAAAAGTFGTLGALGAAISTVRENVSGAYDVTISFGGILGGTAAVVLAALGNSVIWLRGLFVNSMALIGNSAAVLAAFLGGIWDDPLNKALGRFMLFGNSAFSIIGAVVKGVGSIGGGALSISGALSSKNNSFDALGGTVYGGNSPLFKNSVFSSLFSTGKNVFSSDYIRYDNAFLTGYLIGDILMRYAGAAGKGGSINTRISKSTSLEKISADVSGISANTQKAAAVTEISGDDLKYLRDIAARDVINRFTAAQISVSMGGVTNNLNGTADLDGIVDYLANGVKTAMECAAEGVHS